MVATAECKVRERMTLSRLQLPRTVLIRRHKPSTLGRKVTFSRSLLFNPHHHQMQKTMFHQEVVLEIKSYWQTILRKGR
jgi:hypothetical protein